MRNAEDQVQRRLKGYIRFPRAFAYLIIDKKLTFGDFAFYYLLVCLARFDSRNPLYGAIELTRTELAIELNINPKTVRNYLNRLIRFELIIKKEKVLKVFRYEDLFTSPKTFFTKGNQRSTISIFFTSNWKSLTQKKNKTTAFNNITERINNENEDYIYENPLSSYKGNISSLSGEDNKQHET
jgi:hypothetical protein